MACRSDGVLPRSRRKLLEKIQTLDSDSAGSASCNASQPEKGETQPPPIAKKGKTKTKKAHPKDSQDLDQLPPLAKPGAKPRKSKLLIKKERDELIAYLDSIDVWILRSEVNIKLNEQVIPDKLMTLVCKLRDAEQPLLSIIASHQSCFLGLYKQCKKSPDSFVNFQFQWYQYCSAFLLSSQYSLTEIDLKDPGAYQISDYQISEVRTLWIGFCEENGFPVPESNPIMMTVSSAIYHCLLDHVSIFQSSSLEKTSPTLQEGEDVYYRFGGAAISDMLHLRYKQIKSCRDDQRDILSQEITLLHCINSKDKTNIPQYLSYRDQGYMYFPDAVFLPFIRDVDTSVKEVVNFDGLKQEGDNLIKVAHDKVKSRQELVHRFREALVTISPNVETTYSDEAIQNVYSTFTRKICNTRIQEFLSATKQHLATQKGLASTVDLNLRTTLLAYRAKLESNLSLSG